MKRTTAQISLIVLTALLISSCDSPRAQRAVVGSSTSNSLNNSSGFNPSTSTGTGTTTGGTTTENTTTTSNIPEDAKHCKFSTDGLSNFASNSTHLGPHTLCKSSTDANSFYFQLKTPPVGTTGDVNICFIPTTSSGSNSIYVGNPMCGSFSDPKAVKKITFVKYSSYTNASINGVIFFKDTSYYYPVYNRTMMTLAAYQGCMNMLAYGNTTYCDAFKSVGQYVYQAF
jgi:hypothetical protein